MGFQPTFDKDVYFLMFGNLVVPITFNEQEIQVSEKRKHEIIMQGNDQNLWAVREIAPGIITVGYFGG